LDVEEERLTSSLDHPVKITSMYDNLNLKRKFSAKTAQGTKNKI
jgi:hypothetical protein